jgi:predicted dehydrogenase
MRISTDLSAVLADKSIDALVICVPPMAQVELAFMALQANKHVIVEKPIGLHPEAILTLEQEARTRKKVILSPYHLRFNPLLEQLAELLRQEKLGNITQFYHRMYILRDRKGEWVYDQRQSGGVIFETLVHGIHLFSWLVKPPVAVAAHGHITPEGLVDGATLVLYTADGAIGTIEGTWLADEQIPFGRLDMIGTAGSAAFDRGYFYRRHYALDVWWKLDGKVEVVNARLEDDDTGFRRLVGYFLECCAAGRLPQRIGLQTAYVAAQVAQTATEALHASRTIPVVYKTFPYEYT